MVEAAHRNGELVAHFAAQSFTLREAKMMQSLMASTTHETKKAVWQLIGRGRDRVPDAARTLQVRSYLVAALEHLWLWHRVTKPPYRRGQYHRASPRASAAILAQSVQ